MITNNGKEYMVGRIKVRIEMDEDALNPRRAFPQMCTIALCTGVPKKGDPSPMGDEVIQTSSRIWLSALAARLSGGNVSETAMAGLEKLCLIHEIRIRMRGEDLVMEHHAFTGELPSTSDGFIYLPFSVALKEFGFPEQAHLGWDGPAAGFFDVGTGEATLQEAALQVMISELEEYQHYLNGRVYRYCCTAPDGTVRECGNYYGDLELCEMDARAEAESMSLDLEQTTLEQ